MLKINEYFYRLKGKDLFVHKNHSHNEIEFIQIINGNGLVIKNDKTYVLQSQHIYAIDARNAHIVYPQPEDCSDYIRNKIVIDADSFSEFYADMGEILHKLFDSEPVCTVANPEIDKIYKTVSELCSSQRKENIAFATGYITELIHWIYTNSEIKPPSDNKDTFQKMLGIINETDGLTSLGEISRTLHLDKHYLCRLFKEKTGVTLSDYLSEKIFEKSRKLLESTSYSIEEIAQKCGFSSQASLTRFFKNKCGISPSKYRRDKKPTYKLHI
ncbi:MAG: helix-turn-helix transcriptional regulator [Clostridia bacterium]|nr:helix-turn-helix transcriptional regulator [Clostridia bacterium]